MRIYEIINFVTKLSITKERKCSNDKLYLKLDKGHIFPINIMNSKIEGDAIVFILFNEEKEAYTLNKFKECLCSNYKDSIRKLSGELSMDTHFDMKKIVFCFKGNEDEYYEGISIEKYQDNEIIIDIIPFEDRGYELNAGLKRKIIEILSTKMRTLDLDINRNETNRHIFNKILNKCFNDLEDMPMLAKYLNNTKSIKNFIEQTVFYLILDRDEN